MPKMIELSCPTGVNKEGRSLDCIIHQLNVSYPEGEDSVHVHIYAKRY